MCRWMSISFSKITPLFTSVATILAHHAQNLNIIVFIRCLLSCFSFAFVIIGCIYIDRR